ncbi:MAG: sigma-70 family RNA polymerase sigma factor, partial [Cyanobacteria bacterium P01_D01_bin.73]
MGRVASRDAVQVYLNEIGQIPLLTALQERELGRKIQAWLALPDPKSPRSPVECQIIREGQRAKSKLISSNLRLVVSIAKRYTSRGLDLLDLIQEGNLGLDRAADKFNPALGYKFSTYATWWIRQGVVRGLANQGRTIRLPVQMVERVRKLRQASSRLTARFGRTPTVEELAEELEITADGVWALMRHTRTPRSLDAYVVSRSPRYSDGEDRLIDIIADPCQSDQEF